LYLNNKFYLFSTYNKSTFSEIHNSTDTLDVTLRNRNNILNIRVIKNSFCDLRAPVSGEMSRGIKESIDSEVHLQLSDNQAIFISGYRKKGGLEIIEEIFKYI